ncbi:monovalent cation/H(+) antiporter subunit G [Nakamurella deserti]|uniref:monovalent cation/H(+) antiporter subunit G n=1 Tax=Nakamurella deserti TaxID=2164074 RepID=UPI000DBE14AB|nr:monovalent cation/H(+) antiporter subunit G [Nakamurella deserti]
MNAYDVIAAVLLVLGAAMSLFAGVALLRFPDLMSRAHAAAKPQVLGTLLLMAGAGFAIRTPGVIGLLLLIAVLQLATAPIAAHLVVRAGHRRDAAAERPELAHDGNPTTGD